MKSDSDRRMRILLDSNIWRYVVDAHQVPALRNAVRRSKHSLVIAPAVLYEAAHTFDKVLRNALLSAMVDPSWKRLMPEAYSEAEEFKSEVRRLRPEWLRAHPNLERFKRIRYDWLRSKGGLWDRMPSDADLLQRDEEESGLLARARRQAHDLREDASSWSPKLQTASLTKMLGSFPQPIPGWNGTPVEPWRVDALTVLGQAVQTTGHATVDWIEDEIDVPLMLRQSSSQVKFWFHDVDLMKMPRHWLRWAFEFLQRQRRVSDGTPVDAQLGTYLVDADVVLSADKVFIFIAERCREDAPFVVAEPRLLPGGEAAVEAVLSAFASTGRVGSPTTNRS